MTTFQRKAFYQTREWKNMSRDIRQRDDWLCTSCRPRRVAAELVHHIKPLSENGPALDPANLTSLCSECHRQIHAVVVDQGKQEWVNYIKNLMEKSL